MKNEMRSLAARHCLKIPACWGWPSCLLHTSFRFACQVLWVYYICKKTIWHTWCNPVKDIDSIPHAGLLAGIPRAIFPRLVSVCFRVSQAAHCTQRGCLRWVLWLLCSNDCQPRGSFLQSTEQHQQHVNNGACIWHQSRTFCHSKRLKIWWPGLHGKNVHGEALLTNILATQGPSSHQLMLLAILKGSFVHSPNLLIGMSLVCHLRSKWKWMQAHERLLSAFAAVWGLDSDVVQARLNLTKPAIQVTERVQAFSCLA